jgi:hypothetical protein
MVLDGDGRKKEPKKARLGIACRRVPSRHPHQGIDDPDMQHSHLIANIQDAAGHRI